MKKTGMFNVDGILTGPTGRSEPLSLLVDTGAIFLVLTRAIADRLDLRSVRSCAVEIAGGHEVQWPLAEVRLRLGEHEVTTPCLICADGPVLLGAVALESLLLAVDPVHQRLVPVRAFALTAA